MTQPKALYLADVLEYIPDNINKAAAAELRRLHAECEHHKAWVAHITAENKSLEAQRDPVAWMHTNAVGHVYFRKKPQDRVFNPQPLFTAPPQRKPLTEEEIAELGWQEQLLLVCDGLDELTEIARAVERAHGIGEQQ